MDLKVSRTRLRLKRELQTSFGVLRERETITVCLTDADGVAGYGEASPLEPYDGVSIERVHHALERYREVLTQNPGAQSIQLIEACRAVDDLPQALAAIDLALWDRAGRRRGLPVCSLITDAPATAVPVNATVSASDRASAAEQAAAAARAGFGCLKVKVGVGDDAGRLAAVRAAAGSGVLLRVDANGAWEVEQAVRAINALEPVGLELVEEPTHGLRAIQEVRARVAARVAIDETAAEPGALGANAADAVCLKISRCGGISNLLAAATLVRTAGAEAYISSSLDGPLGVAAAVHAAAGLAAHGPMPHCGLATLDLFEDLDGLLPVRSGEIEPPRSPGLGVSPP
ncbi:MAG TPA: mandelate racemase/muconate lactonizing enzyme family protein [Solirubrobacteraceae bacterium]